MLSALHQERVSLAQAEERLGQLRGRAQARERVHHRALGKLAAAPAQELSAVTTVGTAERWLLELFQAQGKEDEDGAVVCFDLETGPAAAPAALRHHGCEGHGPAARRAREPFFSFSTQCGGCVARCHVTATSAGPGLAWSVKLPRAEEEGTRLLREAYQPHPKDKGRGAVVGEVVGEAGAGEERGGAVHFIRSAAWPEMRTRLQPRGV